MAIPKRKDVSSKSGVTKYGADAKFADPVNKKYPLDTPAHVRNAASRIGSPKNAGKYPAAAQAEIKGRIRSAEKKLGIGDAGKKPENAK
jgi:hypothetical protein